MFVYWLMILILMVLSFAFGVVIKSSEENPLTPLFFFVGAILLVVLSLTVVLNPTWFS